MYFSFSHHGEPIGDKSIKFISRANGKILSSNFDKSGEAMALRSPVPTPMKTVIRFLRLVVPIHITSIPRPALR